MTGQFQEFEHTVELAYMHLAYKQQSDISNWFAAPGFWPYVLCVVAPRINATFFGNQGTFTSDKCNFCFYFVKNCSKFEELDINCC